MSDLPNPAKVVIGFFREDGDFDIIAAVNNYQFADDGQTLRALLALIQANRPDSEDIVVLVRDECLDVLAIPEDEAAPLVTYTYQPVLLDGASA